MLMLAVRRKGPALKGAVAAIVILGLVPIIGSLYAYARKQPEIYRLRTTVLDPARIGRGPTGR